MKKLLLIFTIIGASLFLSCEKEPIFCYECKEEFKYYQTLWIDTMNMPAIIRTWIDCDDFFNEETEDVVIYDANFHHNNSTYDSIFSGCLTTITCNNLFKDTLYIK